MGAALAVAQTSLVASGNSFVLDTGTWSFVPRTFNDNIGHLSNHALGKAIDVNPKNNPHIKSKDEILVIDAVCSQILPNGFLRETNPDVLRNASQHFKVHSMMRGGSTNPLAFGDCVFAKKEPHWTNMPPLDS